MKEIFKPVIGYEGLYEVSNLGRIYSFYKQKFIHPRSNGRGYLQVELTKDKKQKMHFIHRLVAIAFLPNPEKLPQVNHKDENKENNCIDNLEWCTSKYNMSYGTRTERAVAHYKKTVMQLDTDDNVIQIYDSVADAERMNGFNHSNIVNVCNGKHKTAYGFKWKYVNGGLI